MMTLESRDRFHAKQGRSTARVVLDPGGPAAGGLSQAAFPAPLAGAAGRARRPGGKHSPAAAEWAHLEQRRALGIDVPEVVAAGERIGPGPVCKAS